MNVPTPTERTLSSAPHAAYASGFKRIAGFGIGTALLLLCIIASLMLGSKAIPSIPSGSACKAPRAVPTAPSFSTPGYPARWRASWPAWRSAPPAR